MSTFFKFIGISALIFIVSTSSYASIINVGGVNWDPDDAADWSGVTSLIHQDIDAGTGELSGYGRVTSMNNTGSATFCPGCELTVQFGGYLPLGSTLLPSAGLSIDYNGGFFNLYVDFSPETDDFDFTKLSLANTGSEAGANALWLNGIGAAFSGITTFTGTAANQGNRLELSGLSFLDVVGGLAATNLNTNTIATSNGFADIKFSSSFAIDVTQTSANGSGNYAGDSVSVSVGVPNMMGVLALGILFMYRRSYKNR
jgi:hypothetical protein